MRWGGVYMRYFQAAGLELTTLRLTLNERSYFLPRAPSAETRPIRERSRDHICENTLRNTPAPVFAAARPAYDAWGLVQKRRDVSASEKKGSKGDLLCQ